MDFYSHEDSHNTQRVHKFGFAGKSHTALQTVRTILKTVGNYNKNRINRKNSKGNDYYTLTNMILWFLRFLLRFLTVFRRVYKVCVCVCV